MNFVKLTTNRRITFLALLRKKYGLTPGRRVKFEATEGGIEIFSLATPGEIKTNVGFLGTRGKLLKTLMKEKKSERNL